MAENGRNIQSVQRAIDIINCIGGAKRGVTLKDISAFLDLNINTARGLVYTLLDNGFLTKNVETNSYSLGYEFLTKSKLVYEAQIRHIQDLAYPSMEFIAQKFNVSCWLQISFYHDIYTVEVVEAPSSHYAYAPKSGANLPLHATASGKLHIAYMPEEERKKVLEFIRLERFTEHTITDRADFAREIERVYSKGYASELEEIDIGISSIGVPLFDTNGMLAGTLSIVASAAIVNRIFQDVILDLRRSGDRITQTITARRKNWSLR